MTSSDAMLVNGQLQYCYPLGFKFPKRALYNTVFLNLLGITKLQTIMTLNFAVYRINDWGFFPLKNGF